MIAVKFMYDKESRAAPPIHAHTSLSDCAIIISHFAITSRMLSDSTATHAQKNSPKSFDHNSLKLSVEEQIMAATSILVVLILTQLLVVSIVAADSRSDEERRQAVCKGLRATGHVPPLAHPANSAVLMDSWNYQNLLPPRTGAVWQQVDNDTNNIVGLATNVSSDEY